MQAIRFRRNSEIPGGWDYAYVTLAFDEKINKYVVQGFWPDDKVEINEETMAHLALLIASPPNTHIHGIGFRSDYEGDDRYIEAFFYVVM